MFQRLVTPRLVATPSALCRRARPAAGLATFRSLAARAALPVEAVPSLAQVAPVFVSFQRLRLAAVLGGTAVVTHAAALAVAGCEAAPAAAAREPAADDADDELPLIALEELEKHRSTSSIWVTYNGLVYDVTEFLMHHPGGHELLLTAGGLDLGHFFENYKVHTATDKAANYLAGYVIGRCAPPALRLAARPPDRPDRPDRPPPHRLNSLRSRLAGSRPLMPSARSYAPTRRRTSRAACACWVRRVRGWSS